MNVGLGAEAHPKDERCRLRAGLGFWGKFDISTKKPDSQFFFFVGKAFSLHLEEFHLEESFILEENPSHSEAIEIPQTSGSWNRVLPP